MRYFYNKYLHYTMLLPNFMTDKIFIYFRHSEVPRIKLATWTTVSTRDAGNYQSFSITSVATMVTYSSVLRRNDTDESVSYPTTWSGIRRSVSVEFNLSTPSNSPCSRWKNLRKLWTMTTVDTHASYSRTKWNSRWCDEKVSFPTTSSIVSRN